ncbi:MAG: LLM class flavin-dependent oxidoreductase [Actinobacteria bacterium]|nr:LLM class flavin-dependent oxidoreductase [Actinomycetota bacterium]
MQFQTHDVEPARFVSVAREAAELGVDGVFLWDHMIPFVGSPDDSAWETWSLLGAMAGATPALGVDLGVLVSPLSFRHPQILARSAATVARLADRRFVLGVGAGGFVHDDRLFDDQRSLAQRMSEFGRRLATLREVVDDQNRRHGVDIRIWVGGDGPNVTIPLAARWADGWSGFAPYERWRTRKELLEAHETRPALEISVLLTPRDASSDDEIWRASGADWLIRSLRPDGLGGFDLDPIRHLVAAAR